MRGLLTTFNKTTKYEMVTTIITTDMTAVEIIKNTLGDLIFSLNSAGGGLMT
jgi:hypothetical protein